MAKQIIAVVESIPFSRQTVQDNTKYTDYRVVTTPGQNGARTTLHLVTTDDVTGQELSREPYKKELSFPVPDWNRQTDTHKVVQVDNYFVINIDDDLKLTLDLNYPNASSIALKTDSDVVDYHMAWDAGYAQYGATEGDWNRDPVTEITTVGTMPIVTTETRVERETVHYSSIAEYDDTKLTSYVWVRQQGEDGYDDVTYLYTYDHGQLVSKTEQSRAHTKTPTNKITVYGTVDFVETREIEYVPVGTDWSYDLEQAPSYWVETYPGVVGQIEHTYRTKYVRGVAQPETTEEINVETLVEMVNRRVTKGAKGECRWLRQKWLYTDGHVSYSAPWRDGKTGRGVSAVTVQYGISTSDQVPPVDWTDRAPTTWNDGEIIWRRQKVTYDNGEIDYTDANALIGTEMDALRQQANEIVAGYTEIKAGQANFVTYNALGERGQTSINGANITTGIISAGNGASTINLENGAFSFANGALKWSPGSTSLTISGGGFRSVFGSSGISLYQSSSLFGYIGRSVVSVGGRNMATGTPIMLLSVPSGAGIGLGINASSPGSGYNAISITPSGDLIFGGMMYPGNSSAYGLELNNYTNGVSIASNSGGELVFVPGDLQYRRSGGLQSINSIVNRLETLEAKIPASVTITGISMNGQSGIKITCASAYGNGLAITAGGVYYQSGGSNWMNFDTFLKN